MRRHETEKEFMNREELPGTPRETVVWHHRPRTTKSGEL